MALKPCPFCGGEPETEEETWCDQDGVAEEVLVHIRCDSCNVCLTGGGADYRQAEDDAFTKWNRRTNDA